MSTFTCDGCGDRFRPADTSGHLCKETGPKALQENGADARDEQIRALREALLQYEHIHGQAVFSGCPCGACRAIRDFVDAVEPALAGAPPQPDYRQLLAELVEQLPNCQECDARLATYGNADGEYSCDEHHVSDHYELPEAKALRAALAALGRR